MEKVDGDDAVADAMKNLDIQKDVADELRARAEMAKKIAKEKQLDLKDAKYVSNTNEKSTKYSNWVLGKNHLAASKHFKTKEEACLYFLVHVKPELDKHDGKLTKEQCKMLYVAGGNGEVADYFAAKKKAANVEATEAGKNRFIDVINTYGGKAQLWAKFVRQPGTKYELIGFDVYEVKVWYRKKGGNEFRMPVEDRMLKWLNHYHKQQPKNVKLDSERLMHGPPSFVIGSGAPEVQAVFAAEIAAQEAEKAAKAAEEAAKAAEKAAAKAGKAVVDKQIQNILDVLYAMEVDSTLKIDLALGTRQFWNQALEEINAACILDGRWYSDEVDDDDEVTCFAANTPSESEDESEDEDESEEDAEKDVEPQAMQPFAHPLD